MRGGGREGNEKGGRGKKRDNREKPSRFGKKEKEVMLGGYSKQAKNPGLPPPPRMGIEQMTSSIEAWDFFFYPDGKFFFVAHCFSLGS